MRSVPRLLVPFFRSLRSYEPGAIAESSCSSCSRLAIAGIAGDLFKFVHRARTVAADASSGRREAVLEPVVPVRPRDEEHRPLPALLLSVPARLDWNRVAQGLLAVLALAVSSRVLMGEHFLRDMLAAVGTATLFFPLAVVARQHDYREIHEEIPVP